MKRTVLGCACSSSYFSGEDRTIDSGRSEIDHYSSLFPNFVVIDQCTNAEADKMIYMKH